MDSHRGGFDESERKVKQLTTQNSQLMLKGIIFDYGGTLDTNGIHWAEVLWEQYQALGLPVEKSHFREAYVHGERTMARQLLVQPDDDFRQVLLVKSRLQLAWLVAEGLLDAQHYPVEKYAEALAGRGYAYASQVVKNALEIVEKLKMKYNLVLVSNFYGNIHAILKDFGLLYLFNTVIESAVVGVRKPDPAIYRLGVEAMGFRPDEIAVVGDSYSKDMIPAHAVGCRTVWLKGIGWGSENEEADITLPDVVIGDLAELPAAIERLEI